MTPSDDLIEFLRWWEGIGGRPALSSYQDSVGVWTIAYGRTNGCRQGDKCTPEQAEVWLRASADGFGRGVTLLVKPPIQQCQFDALTSFAYNLGLSSLATSTLIRMVNEGDLAAAANQFPRWDHAGGMEVAGLLKRRVSEMHMFNDGDYTGRP